MKQSKMYAVYAALAGFGATSPEKGLTSTELASKSGRLDLKTVSTNLSQMTQKKRGVLSRDLVDGGEGMPRVWKYWVVGPFQGRGAPAVTSVTPRQKRKYVRRQVAQVTAGEYKVTISGPDLILERTVSNGLLSRVINTLIEQ